MIWICIRQFKAIRGAIIRPNTKFGYCESHVVLRATVRKLPPMWCLCERLSTIAIASKLPI